MGRLIAGLFLLLFAFYALTGPGYSISGDGSFLLLSARNLLRTGSSSVPAIPDTELSRRRGVDGREYAKFAPGLVFAHLPMLLAVQHLEPLRRVGSDPPIDGQNVVLSGSNVNMSCGNSKAPTAPTADPKDVADPYGS